MIDTTLTGRKVTWKLAIIYGVVAQIIPIIVHIIYTLVTGQEFSQIYFRRDGLMISMGVGFLTVLGTCYWINKPSKERTMVNSARIMLIAIVTEILFHVIIGVFDVFVIFSFLAKGIAAMLATFFPKLFSRRSRDLHKN